MTEATKSAWLFSNICSISNDCSIEILEASA
jgi:hypothetical protein